MKLITEHTDHVATSIVEDKNGKKNFFIEGIFMQAEQKNRNGRIYPKNILAKAVTEYNESKVKTKRAVGELNHPDGPGINLDKVSHRITEVKWSGNDVLGKALILDTPMGQIVKGLLEGECQLGVSTRGMGTVRMKEGTSIIEDGFALTTVDIVQDPSAPSAFVNGIMEGVEYFFDGDDYVAQAAEDTQKQIKRMSVKRLAEAQEQMFADFIAKITI